MVRVNPIRYSSKYQDDESDLLCYGYRYYDPSTGRWSSRDSMEDSHSASSYSFVSNDPNDHTDMLGLWTETSAVAKLKRVEEDWKSEKWNLAAKLLHFFYTKQSPSEKFILKGSVEDAQEIKNDSMYRQKQRCRSQQRIFDC